MSIAATWAGIGSLMNGVEMTKTYGIIPSLIWVLGNVLACIVYGLIAPKIPKVREVFCSKPMMWICGIMCVFQSWLSMNGMQTVFTDTALGSITGTVIAYAEAVLFIVILDNLGARERRQVDAAAAERCDNIITVSSLSRRNELSDVLRESVLRRHTNGRFADSGIGNEAASACPSQYEYDTEHLLSYLRLGGFGYLAVHKRARA